MTIFPQRPYFLKGFTVIELLVAVTILALLAVFAVPAIGSLFAQNRAAALANNFTTSLHYARSEAIKRGTFVTLCAASDDTQTACASASTTSWSNGWIIFVDTNNNGDGVMNGTDTILRKQESFPTGTVITAPGGRITYQANGFIRSGTNTGAGTYTLKPTNCSGPIGGRQVVVSSVGHPTLSQVPCP